LYENIRGQELEESRSQQRQTGTASYEGQGLPGAVEPMMMMTYFDHYIFR